MPARARGPRWTSRGRPARRDPRRVWLPAALLAVACGAEPAPSERVCAEILALQSPSAAVVETWLGADGVALDYRVADDGPESSHRLECGLAETAPGRLRVRSLRLDGRELSEAELLLVNAELLLTEIRRADPGPPRATGSLAAWLVRVLPRS